MKAINKDSRLIKILKNLKVGRIDNIQKLKDLPYNELKRFKDNYWSGYQLSKENNNKISEMVLYEKYSIINEAITIKKGNEEEVWDSLS
ncbi:MAG: hypothetical protein ABI723_08145 [Bacteroidia bacterium]